MDPLLNSSEKNINNYKRANYSESNNKSVFITTSVAMLIAFFSQEQYDQHHYPKQNTHPCETSKIHTILYVHNQLLSKPMPNYNTADIFHSSMVHSSQSRFVLDVSNCNSLYRISLVVCGYKLCEWYNCYLHMRILYHPFSSVYWYTYIHCYRPLEVQNV